MSQVILNIPKPLDVKNNEPREILIRNNIIAAILRANTVNGPQEASDLDKPFVSNQGINN